ncbi:MAG: hypothetical protein UT26_C0002G0017 [Microgenomates group bacterium GW2011_GWC1_39_12]|nr:MAG: hypothetical protein UT26_C0002G0017 [Microgenomates group bacterium GW2011_GWC1_39_12]
MPSRPSARKKSKSLNTVISPAGIVTLLVIIALISGGIYLSSRRKAPTKTTTSIVKPTPKPYPLPQGPQTYPFSYGSAVTGPKPSEVLINPYDPKKDEKQTFTVKAKYDKPITYAAIDLETDHGVKTYPMQRISGIDTDGVWEVTITTIDTHDYIYNVGLDFRSNTIKTSTKPELTLRAY